MRRILLILYKFILSKYIYILLLLFNNIKKRPKSQLEKGPLQIKRKSKVPVV